MRLIDADALKGVFVGEYPGMYTKKYIKNLIDGMPTVGGWISVKERMPEPLAQCLVYSDTRRPRGMETATYTEFGWMTAAYFPEITHWMPLPEPPEEVSENATD